MQFLGLSFNQKPRYSILGIRMFLGALFLRTFAEHGKEDLERFCSVFCSGIGVHYALGCNSLANGLFLQLVCRIIFYRQI